MSYAYLWQFQVNPEEEGHFLEHYGPAGTWARLFRQADGFIETLLLRDRDHPCRYVTVDRWESVSAYEAFRSRFADEYADLDRAYERLTISEQFIGSFDG